MNSQSHILLHAGGLSLALDSSSIHRVHDGLLIQPEDTTARWFLGLAVADERLLPVTDLGRFLGGSASHGRVLEVSRHLGIAGLRIDEVVGVSCLSPQRTDLPGDGPLQSLAINDLEQDFQLLDLSRLMRSSRFLHVQHELEIV